MLELDFDDTQTVPLQDTLVPELKNAWDECRRVFGSENVLIVSNSAGTHLDPGGIQVCAKPHLRFLFSYSYTLNRPNLSLIILAYRSYTTPL